MHVVMSKKESLFSIDIFIYIMLQFRGGKRKILIFVKSKIVILKVYRK